jgi:xanthine/uracil permease
MAMSDDTGRPGPPPAPYGGMPLPPPSTGASMALRHLLSVIVAVVVTPIGLAMVDIGATRWMQYAVQRLEPEGVPFLAYALAAIGCVLLLVAAAAGRVSGLGPLLAGILWGAIPTLWILVDFRSFWERSNDLPDVWDHTFWFSYAPIMFPITGALLVGAGLAGRWSSRP